MSKDDPFGLKAALDKMDEGGTKAGAVAYVRSQNAGEDQIISEVRAIDADKEANPDLYPDN